MNDNYNPQQNDYTTQQPTQQPAQQPTQQTGQAQQFPYGAMPPQQPAPDYPYPPQPGYYYPPTERWNVLCIVGFILAFIIPPAGLVLSIVALVQINKSHEKSKGMSIAGIIIGAISTLLMVAVIGFAIWAVGFAIDHTDDIFCENGVCHYNSPYGYDDLNGHDDLDDELQRLLDQYGTDWDSIA